jgi:membrane protease YdiL (CAAX protease family)
MILLNNVAEEIGWTGFAFDKLQDRHGPLRAALLTTLFFSLFHVQALCRNALIGNHGAGAGHLPAAASGQPIDHWLAL